MKRNEKVRLALGAALLALMAVLPPGAGGRMVRSLLRDAAALAQGSIHAAVLATLRCRLGM